MRCSENIERKCVSLNEAVVATVGRNALVLDTPETKALGSESTLIERRANGMQVRSEIDCLAAKEFLKSVKDMKKKVKDYWEPLRLSTKKSYDDVLAKKKEMTDPLDNAEKTVNRKLSDYAWELEKKRREEEAARLREIENAVDAKMEEAAAAEASGDALGAEMAFAEAEVYDSIGTAPQAAPAKISGMSQKLGWEIVQIIPELVPITICGVEVHISNKSVIEQLVRQAIEKSGGRVQIPGVTYKETMKVSIH